MYKKKLKIFRCPQFPQTIIPLRYNSCYVLQGKFLSDPQFSGFDLIRFPRFRHVSEACALVCMKYMYHIGNLNKENKNNKIKNKIKSKSK